MRGAPVAARCGAECGDDGHKAPPTKTSSTLVGHKKPHRRRRGFPLGDAVELDREAIPRACGSPPAIPGAIPRPPRTRSSFLGAARLQSGTMPSARFRIAIYLQTKTRYFST